MKLFKIKIGNIYLWWLLSVLFIFIIGIIVGSFLDLQISYKFASDDSLYGKIFESFGEVLGYAISPIAGGIFVSALYKRNSSVFKKICAVLIGFICWFGATYYAQYNVSGQAGYSWKYNEIIGFIICGVFYFGVLLLTFLCVDKTKSTKNLVITGLCLFLSLIIPVIFVNFVCKGMAYRPRFRAMAWDNAINGTKELGFDYYRNWWQFNFFKKPEWFYTSNIPSDYIKSWPSGHTTCATVFLTFPLAVSVFKDYSKKKSAIWFIVAALYSFSVAIARVNKGAHFLSDVCFGGLITTIFIIIICGLLQKLNKEKVIE